MPVCTSAHNGKRLRVVVQSHTTFKHAPVLADNSLQEQCEARPRSPMRSPKGKTAEAQTSNQGSQDKKKGKGKSKGKERKSKPSAKSGDVDFDEDAQAEPDEPEGQDADQDEDPEAYLVEAQTSEESEMDSDGMLDWSASECKDYKDRAIAIATVACACPPDSSAKQRYMGMEGTLLSCKSTSPVAQVPLHSDMEREYLTRPHSPASANYPRKAPLPQDQSLLSPVIENVKSAEKLLILGLANLTSKLHQMLVAKVYSAHQPGYSSNQ